MEAGLAQPTDVLHVRRHALQGAVVPRGAVRARAVLESLLAAAADDLPLRLGEVFHDHRGHLGLLAVDEDLNDAGADLAGDALVGIRLRRGAVCKCHLAGGHVEQLAIEAQSDLHLRKQRRIDREARGPPDLVEHGPPHALPAGDDGAEAHALALGLERGPSLKLRQVNAAKPVRSECLRIEHDGRVAELGARLAHTSVPFLAIVRAENVALRPLDKPSRASNGAVDVRRTQAFLRHAVVVRNALQHGQKTEVVHRGNPRLKLPGHRRVPVHRVGR
mmetsp:Transcript_99863/g.286899  ORF Transcript_99863/g.286899 Transcript_99863/m.286899 type:complete len:276 (+) Transcript_99863:3098-3925(+)